MKETAKQPQQRVESGRAQRQVKLGDSAQLTTFLLAFSTAPFASEPYRVITLLYPILLFLLRGQDEFCYGHEHLKISATHTRALVTYAVKGQTTTKE